MPELPDLPGHRLDDRGVGVAERVDGDAAEHVDIRPAGVVGHDRTVTADEGERRRAVRTHDGVAPPARALAARSCTSSLRCERA